LNIQSLFLKGKSANFNQNFIKKQGKNVKLSFNNINKISEKERNHTGAVRWKNGYPGSGTRILSPGLRIDRRRLNNPIFAPWVKITSELVSFDSSDPKCLATDALAESNPSD